MINRKTGQVNEKYTIKGKFHRKNQLPQIQIFKNGKYPPFFRLKWDEKSD